MPGPGRLPDCKPAATRADHSARTTTRHEVSHASPTHPHRRPTARRRPAPSRRPQPPRAHRHHRHQQPRRPRTPATPPPRQSRSCAGSAAAWPKRTGCSRCSRCSGALTRGRRAQARKRSRPDRQQRYPLRRQAATRASSKHPSMSLGRLTLHPPSCRGRRAFLHPVASALFTAKSVWVGAGRPLEIVDGANLV